jgi:hypothetical protein
MPEIRCLRDLCSAGGSLQQYAEDYTRLHGNDWDMANDHWKHIVLATAREFSALKPDMPRNVRLRKAEKIVIDHTWPWIRSGVCSHHECHGVI